MFTNKTSDFRRKLDAWIDTSLDLIGSEVVESVKVETPVRTGDLKEANDYDVQDKDVYIYNTKKYAPFVELGTFKQAPNPFMRRGMLKSTNKLVEIFRKELGV